ncbi:MAG: hypothetical protein ACWGQW_23440 [bacterium]
MESVVYIALAPFFLVPSIIFVFAIVEVIAKHKAAKLLRKFEQEADMDHPQREAKRIVRMVYKMYAPRGTNTKDSATITRFEMLVRELEQAIRSRAVGQRDAVVLSLVQLLQSNARV